MALSPKTAAARRFALPKPSRPNLALLQRSPCSPSGPLHASPPSAAHALGLDPGYFGHARDDARKCRRQGWLSFELLLRLGERLHHHLAQNAIMHRPRAARGGHASSDWRPPSHHHACYVSICWPDPTCNAPFPCSCVVHITSAATLPARPAALAAREIPSYRSHLPPVSMVYAEYIQNAFVVQDTNTIQYMGTLQ